jgi:hypothetical protein
VGITVVAGININRVVLGGTNSKDREDMEGTLDINSNSNRLYPERLRTGNRLRLRERQGYLSWLMGCRTRRIRAGLMRLGRGTGVSLSHLAFSLLSRLQFRTRDGDGE